MKKEVIIDLGCGYNKFSRDAIGVDINITPFVDVVCDIEEGLPFKDDSVDYICCFHVMEHINDLEKLLKEIYRVLKREGKIHIIVPHFSNTLAYSDYTHKRFFGYYTFDYFCKKKDKYWNVLTYNETINFNIIKKRLIFRNFPLIGPLFEYIFNKNQMFSYLYESKLSWFISCFEIEFVLQPVKA